ncbi:YraN family protein [Galactobacter caseinivorans]|nr:YraN family protein [Galactobacter caseinivorans]
MLSTAGRNPSAVMFLPRHPGVWEVVAMDAKELGRAGEDFAAAWFQEREGVILERNWRTRQGELDLLVLDADGSLVAVEVKTRSGDGFGHPAESVSRDKLMRLHRLLRAYADGEGGCEWSFTPRRVDVLALVWPSGAGGPISVEHYRGVSA